ncbi:MAG: hypothetical protein HY303_21960 [Candidatus Wallbacteria bacterium]|nr:hypothetical protein [Candidatus Wallbacteria bacterium]
MPMPVEFQRFKTVTALVAAARGTLETASAEMLVGLLEQIDKQVASGRVTLPQKLYREMLLQRKRLDELRTARVLPAPPADV